MNGFLDLFKSEKGVLTVLFGVAVTVLALLGKITFADWREYTLWLMGIYVTGKTVQGVSEAAFKKKPGNPSTPPKE